MSANLRPPRATAWLLRRILPAALRSEIAGDLAEEFAARVREAGDRAKACRWYRREDAAIALRILVGRRRGRQSAARVDVMSRLAVRASAVARDSRLACRSLLRRPGLSMVSIGATALGIGANAVILSVVTTVYLRPLPYPESDRLTIISAAFSGVSEGGFSLSVPEADDIMSASRVFDAMALSLDWQSGNVAIAGRDPERVSLNFVTPSYFGLTGAGFVAGRGFRDSEDGEGRARQVAVLTHAYWTERLGADPAAIGMRLRLNGLPFVVVGVLEAGHVDLSTRLGSEAGVLLPLHAASRLTNLDLTSTRRQRYVTALARLAPGVTVAQASAEAGRLAERLAAEHASTNRGWTFVVQPLAEVLFQNARTMALLLLAGSVLVLLLVAANIANLELMRFTGRGTELAVRRALGASPTRLMAQLGTESLTRAAIGGGVGIALAHWGAAVLGQASAMALPGFATVTIDAVSLWASVGLVVAVGVSAGVLPAWHLWRRGVPAPGDDAARHTGSAVSARARSTLVIVEVALACALLAGAGSVFGGLMSLTRQSLGYDASNLVTVRLDLRSERYDSDDAQRLAVSELVDRAGGIRGVRQAVLWSPSPLGAGNWIAFLTTPGLFDVDPLARVEASRHHIMPGTLTALGIPVIDGRDFAVADDWRAPDVAIVSSALAQQIWPGESPVGRTLETRQLGELMHLRVIGVAADVQHRPRPQNPFGPQRDVYVPYLQQPQRFINLLLRLDQPADLGPVLTALRHEVAEVDPALPTYGARLMAEQIRDEEGRSRFSTLMLGLFAVVALTLAVMGTSAVLAYAVRQRRRELGIRVALGASPSALVVGLATRGLALVAAGIAAGLVIAVALIGLLAAAVVGINPANPAPFAAAALLVAACGAVASIMPARGALTLDLTRVLRDV